MPAAGGPAPRCDRGNKNPLSALLHPRKAQVAADTVVFETGPFDDARLAALRSVLARRLSVHSLRMHSVVAGETIGLVEQQTRVIHSRKETPCPMSRRTG